MVLRVGENHRAEYACLWNRINGDGAYDRNPWVWALTFRVVTPARTPADPPGAPSTGDTPDRSR